ncbi:MAG: hypothetical protein ACLRXQ_08945 [Phascolarctobacterium faecium]
MEPSSSSTSELVTELVAILMTVWNLLKAKRPRFMRARCRYENFAVQTGDAPLKRQLYCAAAGLTRLW